MELSRHASDVYFLNDVTLNSYAKMAMDGGALEPSGALPALVEILWRTTFGQP